MHCLSSTCHRVAQSVMAVNVDALVYAFNHAYIVREELKKFLGREISFEACVDSRTLFNVISKKVEGRNRGS